MILLLECEGLGATGPPHNPTEYVEYEVGARHTGGVGPVPCPWHAEQTPSCVLSLRYARFYCFGCHAYGTWKVVG